MKKTDSTRLLTFFSAQGFTRTLADLKSAHKNGPSGVFKILTDALHSPGITLTETEGVPSGHLTTSGWKIPSGPAVWPLLVADIRGNGVSYLKTEQIRTHAVIVPLKLNTRNPHFTGAAMAVALLHAYGTFVNKTGQYPQRNLRFVFTPCDETLEAFFERRKVFGPQAFSAIELDLQSSDIPKLSVDSAGFGKRSFVADALLELFEKDADWPIKERTGAIHSLALLPFKIPFAQLQGSLPDGGLRMIRTMGRALLRSLALLGDTDYENGIRFMRPRIRRTAEAMRKNPSKAQKKYSDLLDLLHGFDQLMHRGPWWSNPRSTILRHRKQGHLIDGIYYPRFAFQAWQENELKKLKKLFPPAMAKKPAEPEASPALLKRARSFVPVRAFSGALGPVGFKDGVETWMQAAANLASGKKTVRAIAQQLNQEGFKTGLKELLHFFEKLEKLGRVNRCPIITAGQIRQALNEVGLEKGDVVMIHAGYAAYGYIEAGPKGLIELFQEAVGPSGTICMPTHTGSLVGNLPYDPQNSPAITGLVPNVFAKCPNVLRSLHPTHSVAACGPLAKHLLERSVAEEPVFGDEGFWGRLLKADGKILMFCNSLGPNTILHGVDYWAGVALPDTLAHLIRNGKREEVTVHGMPFHVDSFPHIYKAIEKTEIIRSAPLGKGTVYAMKVRELVQAGLPVVRKNPLLAVAPECDCDYCKHLRRAEARRLLRNIRNPDGIMTVKSRRR